jgi:soluble lytic murein transglycosylase-like protein
MKHPAAGRIILGLAMALCWGLTAKVAAVRADIYTYTDENGVVHFSNLPVDGRYQVYRRMPTPPAPPRDTSTLAKEKRFDDELKRHCGAFEVEPAFAKAVMKVESDFNPQAVSVDGAIGLMQLMPETAERLGVRNPYQPGDNIQGGVKYLRDLLRQFGSLRLAAAAYNAGEHAVSRYGGVPPYDETRTYVRNVLREYEAYRAGGWSTDEGSAPPPANRVYEVLRDDGVLVYTNVPWVYDQPPTR